MSHQLVSELTIVGSSKVEADGRATTRGFFGLICSHFGEGTCRYSQLIFAPSLPTSVVGEGVHSRRFAGVWKGKTCE